MREPLKSPVNEHATYNSVSKIEITAPQEISKENSVACASTAHMSRFELYLGAGSLGSTIFTIISGSVGSGTLTFSYSILMAGTIPSLFYLLFSGMAACYTTYTLVYCSEYHQCSSFRSLAVRLYNTSYANFIQTILLILLWFVAILFMTFTKNLFYLAIYNLFNFNGITNTYLLCILVFCLIIPLSLMHKISALRYASLFGFAASMLVVFAVTFLFFTNFHESNSNILRSNLVSYDFINHSYTFSVMIGGYVVQPTILPIYVELNHKSHAALIKCIVYSFVAMFCIYLFVGYFGYLSFGHEVTPDLLQSDYDGFSGSKGVRLVLVAQIALSLYVVMIVPLYAQSFRRSITQLIGTVRWWYHTVITLGYVLSALGVAIFADNVGSISAFMGSALVPFVCFVFPTSIVWRTEKATVWMKWITTMICAVVIAMSILQLYRQFMIQDLMRLTIPDEPGAVA
eukprot:177099_1